MNGFFYDDDRIARELVCLPQNARLAFAISCAERLFPNYLAFSKKCGWGDARPIRFALDEAWCSLENGHRTHGNGALREACLLVAPEPGDFDTILASSALDATTAAIAVLNELECGDGAGALEASGYCRDSVDMFVQVEGGIPADVSDLEDRLRTHPLMQTELARQYADLELLARPLEWARLKEAWRTNVGNLGL